MSHCYQACGGRSWSRVGLACALAGLLLVAAGAPAPAGEVIGKEALVKLDPRMLHSVVVNCAPGHDQSVDLNPPRFRWFYVPDPTRLQQHSRVLYTFRFQIAETADFAKPIVDVQTDFNFYNELSPLPEGKAYYWRVGYLCQMASWDGREVEAPRQTAPGAWSPPRRFFIPEGTPRWDRSVLRDLKLAEHPRMLFRGGQLDRLREIIASDPLAKAVFRKNVLGPAERMAEEKVWGHWPDSDRNDEIRGYESAAQKVLLAAFAYKITGQEKYRNAVDIFAKIAAYPKGGRSSPEGMGGDSEENSTSVTEYLALAYDWLYDEYSPAQRAAFEASLEWRLRGWLYEFRWGGAWYTHFSRGGYEGPAASVGSLVLQGGDHDWEGTMATFPAAIAIYDKSEVARKFFHLAVNYLIGVGERSAQNGCADQGMAYGHSHLKWLMFQSYYLNSALPGLELTRHPLYREIGRFFVASAPIDLPGAPWGRGDADGRFWGQRRHSLNLLACFTSDGLLMTNWRNGGGGDSQRYRPWVHAAAKLPLQRPLEDTAGEETDFFFPACGWVMSHSLPPTDLRAFHDGAGVIFACRPSHRQNTFFNNNSFQFYAYGQCLNHGGGLTEDPLPFHSLSHNTVLVDGLGQAFGGPDAYKYPVRGAVLAYKKARDYAYWLGDATYWYPRTPYPVSTWKLDFDENVYGKLAVPYLRMFRRHMLFVRKKYLVVFDDLQTDPDHPARFSWLYHVLQKGRVNYDPKTGQMVYPAGDVRVLLCHVADPDGLEFMDLEGLGWLKNPLTGEDFSRNKYTRKEVVENPKAAEIIPAHNFWFTNRRPQANFHFLVVIYPVKPGAADPKITPLDDFTVRVEAGGQTDLISFDASTKLPATLRVDLQAFREPMRLPAAALDQATKAE